MKVLRGLGFLAPIIFIGVYLIMFGFCNLFINPHLWSGWFVYVGTISAAVATWFAGVHFNGKIYQARRKNPLQQSHTHSLFFVPMEYWAIPLTVIVFFIANHNNGKIRRIAIQEKQRLESAEKHFYKMVKVKDDYIMNPTLNDYYKMSFQSDYVDSRKVIISDHTFYIPVKVIDFTEDRIQFFCPLTYTYEGDRNISNWQRYFSTFYHSEEEGYAAWVDKSALRIALPRDFKKQKNSPSVLMPALIGEDPLQVVDIWRIDGPDLVSEEGFFDSPSQLSLKLRNTGIPFIYNEIRYPGNKIIFTNDNSYSLSSRNVRASKPGTLVGANERIFILGDYENSNTESHIELFVEDLEMRKFKFEIRSDNSKITIERVSLDN